MQNIIVSCSPSIYNPNTTPHFLHEIISEIKSDKWKEIITTKIRPVSDSVERDNLKKKYLPYFSPGIYHNNYRTKERLIKSCLFIFDLDDLSQDKLTDLSKYLKNDKSIFCFFKSPSGNGYKILCILDKDIDDYELYSKIYIYYKKIFELKYDIELCKTQDAARPCFLSYDPELILREDDLELLSTDITFPSTISTTNQNKPIKLLDRKIESVIEFLEGRIPTYDAWLKFCFACASLGEEGRPIFQRLSVGNPNYSDTIEKINKQFDICIKNYDSDKTRFQHIYKYAKLLGWRYEKEKENPIEIIKDFLSTKNLKRNIIVRQIIDTCDKVINSNYINTLYCDLKCENQSFSFQDFEKVLFSNFITDFNPLKDFFEGHTDLKAEGNVDKLICAMRPENEEYANYFIRKWLVSVVASVYGNISPLVLVLAGDIGNTGKTEFFRRLLPEELKPYYGESRLDNGKDDYILMCEKLIILNDEFGSKTRLESKLFKELTSKKIFNLREPYGRHNVNLPRLAVLCGTSNEYNIITDPSGNRRIIPIYIEKQMNFELYNSIDKTALWIEICNLYKSNFNYELNNSDIKILEENTTRYVAINPERELIQEYIILPKQGEECKEMSATDIKMYIEKESGQRININKLGAELQYMKFERIRKIRNGKNAQLYRVKLPGLKGIL